MTIVLRRKRFRRTVSLRHGTGVIRAPLTFTRTGGAAFFNSAGTLVEVGGNVPRFAAGGLLLEPARTNLVSAPRTPGRTNWALAGPGLVAAPGIAGPSGIADDASRFTEAASGTLQVFATAAGHSFSAGVTYTFSTLARAGSRSFVQIVAPAATFPLDAWANFDVAAGVVGSFGPAVVGVPRIEAVGGGWWRCSMVATATSGGVASAAIIGVANNPAMPRVGSYALNGGTLDVAYAQTEVGVFPTSLAMPAAGAPSEQTTRFQDILTAPWASVAPRGQCTVLASVRLNLVSLNSGGQTIFYAHDGTNANRFGVRYSNTGLALIRVIANSPTGPGLVGSPQGSNVLLRVAMAVRSDSLSAVIAGGAPVFLAGAPPPVTTFQVGARDSSLDPIFGEVIACEVLDRAVPDSVLQQLVNALPTA
jgi:hypothetical protein